MDVKTTERYKFHVNDLITHKKFVLESCRIMSQYLFENGEVELAKALLERGFMHDNSKMDDDEMESFLELKIKEKPFTNANSQLNDYEKERIAVHWRKNRHHPEYFEDVNDMTELDIIEMVCDWHARSSQYNTDLLDFAITRQKNRFRFPDHIYEKVLKYCRILTESQTE